LMYGAKGNRADRAYRLTAAIEGGVLSKLEDDEHLAEGGTRFYAGPGSGPCAGARRRLCYPLVFAVLRESRGGCSSMAERRTVAPEVAGSKPVIHPMTSRPDPVPPQQRRSTA
jgi:hypothetical protein